MFRATRVVVAGMALAVGLILAGCASTGQTPDTTDHAIMCPKCDTVWIRKSKWVGPKNVRRFSYKQEMTCPDCDKMAKAYFEGDKKVLHECQTCKVTPKEYKPRKPIDHTFHKHQ